jgi:predicted metal-dependent phosphoesterase TrpH
LLIDMHNHTVISSGCSILRPRELIELARSRGLDAICVTDHSKLEGAEAAREIGLSMNFPVFRGIEARTDLGDMLVYGWYEDIPEGVALEELCDQVLGAGAAIFAAHPFHTTGGWNLYSALELRGIDLKTEWEKLPLLKRLTGIEVINGNVSKETNGLARSLASSLGIHALAGSDAHSPQMVATAATLFKHKIATEADLVRSLRSGDFEALRLR